MNRAFGLLNCIEHVLGKELGLKQTRPGGHQNQFYYPLLAFEGFVCPPDPGAVRSRLTLMLEEGFTDLAERIPPQYQGAGLEEGFRVRGLLLLGTLGHDVNAAGVLHRYLEHGDPATRASSAIALLMQGDTLPARTMLMAGEDKTALICLLGALAPVGSKSGREEWPSGQIMPAGTVVPMFDRSLDAPLLQLTLRAAAEDGDRSIYPFALWAVASRVDNPDVRDYVVNLLKTSDEVQTASALVKAAGALRLLPEFADAAKRWVRSPDPALQTWGMEAIVRVKDPEVPRLVTPFLKSDDIGRLFITLSTLWHNAPYDPRVTMDAISEFIERKIAGEGDLMYLARNAVAQIARARIVSEEIRDEARKLLDRIPRRR